MPRGGKRTGTSGKNYANRSDLSGNVGNVPAQPYPMGGSSGYGDQKALMDAQAAVPVGAPPSPAAGLQQPAQPSGPMPGSLGNLGAPTARPMEPVTHGLPSGPGGGPEVLPGAPNLARDLLKRMAQQPLASPEIQALVNSFQ